LGQGWVCGGQILSNAQSKRESPIRRRRHSIGPGRQGESGDEISPYCVGMALGGWYFPRVFMKALPLLVLSAVFCLSVALLPAADKKKEAAPPFTDTTNISKDIIIASDPSSFKELSDGGDSVRKVFDRRTSAWAETKVWLFKVVYADRAEPTEVRVNKEFSDVTKARSLALKYAKVVGQLPACLRTDVQTITIHDGKKPCGGGNHGILIHVQQAEMRESDGFLEEVLFHECTHTSLDAVHASAKGWIDAQKADGGFISTNGAEHPMREDVAGSFLCYFAVKYRQGRISGDLVSKITKAMPARMAYFESQKLDFRPCVGFPPAAPN